jgi:hypothetical protein
MEFSLETGKKHIDIFIKEELNLTANDKAFIALNIPVQEV